MPLPTPPPHIEPERRFRGCSGLACTFAVFVLAAIASCEPAGLQPSSDVSGSSGIAAVAVSQGTSVGARRLVALGRYMRDAIKRPVVRTALAAATKASPYVEWRVPLRHIVNHISDITAFNQFASILTSVTGVSAAIEASRDLELYLPGDSAGTPLGSNLPIDVAVRYPGSRNGLLIGADGGEHPIIGGRHFALANPLLVLAESEIDYDDFESATRGGRRSGEFRTYPLAAPRVRPFETCDPDQDDCGVGGGGGGGGGGGWDGANTSLHTRVYRFAVNNDHDYPWGRMEIEIFGNVAGHYNDCVRYTGIETSTYYYTDSLDYLNTVATAVADTADFNMFGSEDDNEGCVFHLGNDDSLGSFSYRRDGYNSFRYSSLGTLYGIGVAVAAEAP